MSKIYEWVNQKKSKYKYTVNTENVQPSSCQGITNYITNELLVFSCQFGKKCKNLSGIISSDTRGNKNKYSQILILGMLNDPALLKSKIFNVYSATTSSFFRTQPTELKA